MPHAASKRKNEFAEGTVGVFMRQYSHDDKSLGDIVFFEPAPDNENTGIDDNICREKILLVLFINKHISMPKFQLALEGQDAGKILHLLIMHTPKVAYIALDAFRRPIFRCSIVPGARDFGQSWHTDGWLTEGDKRKNIVSKIKKGKPKSKAEKAKDVFYRSHHEPNLIYQKRGRGLTRLMVQFIKLISFPLVCLTDILSQSFGNLQHNLRSTNESKHMCKPNGIIYEYLYESETSSGFSPTFELIIKVSLHR